MPAINPARLKTQTADLIEKLDSHKAFIAALHDLFGFYADRTKRPGRGDKSFSTLRAYNVPKHVLRQVSASLLPALTQKNAPAFELADLLWDQNWVECQILALEILGWREPEDIHDTLSKITRWATIVQRDTRLVETMSKALLQIWQRHPDVVEMQIQGWMARWNQGQNKIGLKVLPYFIQYPAFSNLPIIFSMISPMLKEEKSKTDRSFRAVLTALAKRSPQETAYFLRQHVLITNLPNSEIFIRQNLDVFPAYEQAELRKFLRNRRATQQD